MLVTMQTTTLVAALLVFVYTVRTQGCTSCEKLAGTKYHFWIESSSTNRHIRLVGQQVFLSGYHKSIYEQFWFATTFYECPDRPGIYAATKIGSTYIASRDVASQDLAIESPSGTSFCYNDNVMFKYEEAGGEEVGTLKSFPTERFLDRVQYAGSLVLSSSPAVWLSWPAVIADLSLRTVFKTGLVAGRSARRYAVRGPTTGRSLRLGRLFFSQTPFQFEVIPFKLCKTFDSRGRVIQGTAIVLRSTPQNYIAVPITEDGSIPLPFDNTNRAAQEYSPAPPVRYNLVGLKSYGNDSYGYKKSYINKANIRDRRAIDERFFEAIVQSDGTYRLLSTLHPDRYLGTIESSGGLQLIVAPLSSDQRSTIDYSFSMNIPELSSVLSCRVPSPPHHPTRPPTPPTPPPPPRIPFYRRQYGSG